MGSEMCIRDSDKSCVIEERNEGKLSRFVLKSNRWGDPLVDFNKLRLMSETTKVISNNQDTSASLEVEPSNPVVQLKLYDWDDLSSN